MLCQGWAAVAACCLMTPLEERSLDFGPGSPPEHLGGLMIFRQGDQTTISFGGILIKRHMKVSTATPTGPVVQRFNLPSALHSVHASPLPMIHAAPATVAIEIPDEIGLVYIDGELIRSEGRRRAFQSPPLPPGKNVPLTVRGAFKSGDRLLIEERTILLRAGQTSAVIFDGSTALSVPLPGQPELLPPPKTK